MDEIFAAIAASQGGVVMRSQALAAGYTEAEIDRRRRQKLWVPIRRGAYVERAVYAAMTREQLHVALVHAAVRSLAKPAVVSHVSAAILRGLPSWGLDLSLVHVTRGDLHSPRIEGGVHHHAGELRNDDLEQIDGIWVTSPARTAIDTARVTEFEAAVVVTDALLHRGLVDRGTILDRLESMRDWPGTCNAGRVAEFADGRSESVGESRTRVAFELVGLPRPDLQRLITTPDGKIVGRSDFLFDGLWTIGEFDGRVKYGRLLKPGEAPGDVVWREKQREDRIRDLGYEVGRIIWSDLSDRPAVAERFRAAFARARRRRAVLV
ncbi:MAG TPA: type IV toxin-antitoxin system AbiEi family antitoxin domain-containing protein [Jiangellaceae bacterium]|nr:type IV toxin-antitoxin system AbiEi family antitoxin domain-containing protein [Jiangellaceae bacterium]